MINDALSPIQLFSVFCKGIYKVPEEYVATAAAQAICRFCKKNPNSVLQHVHLVDIKPDMVSLYQAAMQQLVNNGVFARHRAYVGWDRWLGGSKTKQIDGLLRRPLARLRRCWQH